MAVRFIEFVADVIDGQVDVQIIFARRFPVGVNIVYAVTRAVDIAAAGSALVSAGVII